MIDIQYTTQCTDIKNQTYIIQLMRDEEAQVWIAVSDEIPMVLEHESLDILKQRVELATPELLELNGLPGNGFVLDFQITDIKTLAPHG